MVNMGEVYFKESVLFDRYSFHFDTNLNSL